MNHSKEAILILAHGSRDTIAVQEFLFFSEEFKNHIGLSVEIVTAFLELSTPSIPQALKALQEKGVRKITAIPYFLFRAGHVKEEIPEMLDKFRKENPEVEVVYGNSLWPHPNLTQLAKRRIRDALESFPEEVRKDVEVMVVGRGATDKEALQQFSEAVEELKKEIVCKNLKFSFIALAEPKYSEFLPAILKSGTKNLIIFPYYLFTGILVKRIDAIAEESQKNVLGATIKITPHFGLDPLMLDMLKDRILETSLS